VGLVVYSPLGPLADGRWVVRIDGRYIIEAGIMVCVGLRYKGYRWKSSAWRGNDGRDGSYGVGYIRVSKHLGLQ